MLGRHKTPNPPPSPLPSIPLYFSVLSKTPRLHFFPPKFVVYDPQQSCLTFPRWCQLTANCHNNALKSCQVSCVCHQAVPSRQSWYCKYCHGSSNEHPVFFSKVQLPFLFLQQTQLERGLSAKMNERDYITNLSLNQYRMPASASPFYIFGGICYVVCKHSTHALLFSTSH